MAGHYGVDQENVLVDEVEALKGGRKFRASHHHDEMHRYWTRLMDSTGAMHSDKEHASRPETIGVVLHGAHFYDLIAWIFLRGNRGWLIVDFGGHEPKRKGILGHFHFKHGYIKPSDIDDLLKGAGFRVVETGAIGVRNLNFVVAKLV